MIDGKSMKRALREKINESSTSTFMDDMTSYGFLYEAACRFVDRTACMKNEQSITTVADQQGYTLNADFVRLYLMNDRKDLYIKYNDGTSDTFITFKPYQEIIYDNESTTAIPNAFAIIDDSTADTRLSGTTTSAGASSGGECTLTDTSADFSDASAGDNVHNPSDGSFGVVLSKTSSTALVTALFDGTNNDWTSGDSYVIQPQARQKIFFDRPTPTSQTATVYYIQKPAPVYSDYGIYRIPAHHLGNLVDYAAAMYKARDSEPSFATAFMAMWDNKIRVASNSLNQTYNRRGFSVNLKK